MEWEAALVLGWAAVLAEWQEKPRDKAVPRALWGGHRDLGRIKTIGVTGHRYGQR